MFVPSLPSHAPHHTLTIHGRNPLQRPWRATPEQLTRFHSDDYVRFLQEVSPENSAQFAQVLAPYGIGEDCPVFTGLYDFCTISAGGSMAGAMKLNSGDCDVAINWSGGLHHAKKGEASGFCYVNDIVLGILELLKVHERVLYIDIDIHHGDGVEEAFYTTPRVMTFSLHKYDQKFFPGTGHVSDIGAGPGEYHAVNFPLRDGITDVLYEAIFRPVVAAIMETYRPGAIVLQCGADSLAGDRLGLFNLTLRGHGRCVEYVKSFNVPVLMVGGGGYTVRNVSRCWTYETAIMLGEQIPNELPYTEYMEYFSPEFTLQISPAPTLDNLNTPEYLNDVRSRILQNLKYARGTPQLSMHAPPPAAAPAAPEPDDDDAAADPDRRSSQAALDRRVLRDDEFMDDDEDKFGIAHHLPRRVLLTVAELAAATHSDISSSPPSDGPPAVPVAAAPAAHTPAETAAARRMLSRVAAMNAVLLPSPVVPETPPASVISSSAL